MTPEQHLFAACAALALLTFAVGMRLFFVRVRESCGSFKARSSARTTR